MQGSLSGVLGFPQLNTEGTAVTQLGGVNAVGKGRTLVLHLLQGKENQQPVIFELLEDGVRTSELQSPLHKYEIAQEWLSVLETLI